MRSHLSNFGARAALVSLALLAPLAFALRAQSAAEAAAKPVTVFVVRHAEKAVTDPPARDPELSEAGAERARALERLLAKAGVTHLYCTEFLRTRATVEPLGETLGLEPETIAANASGEQIAALRALRPGAVALVAGHSNSVPQLVAGLGGLVPELEQGKLAEDEYDRLFVVTLPAGPGAATQTLELRYGAEPAEEH